MIEIVKLQIAGKPLGAAALKRLGRNEWAYTIKNAINLSSAWNPWIGLFGKNIETHWNILSSSN